ncbi:MAG: signal recognition particle protein [Gammaproteobacteria bacterium]|nr:signal recognition particle protein [Gammaproteobacteria bacterium]
MFENLTDRLSKTLKNLRGQGRLSEDNIKNSLREVRQALLEADVALPVVREFIDKVREKAQGKEVIGSLSPGQALVKVVNDELVAVMGHQHDALDLNQKPPVTILMAGLQGAGKTTTVAKLARRLIEVDKKTVMVASTDVYRPAAIDQLQTLASEVSAIFHPSDIKQKPVDISRWAQEAARKQNVDVLILDTAGRLHIDQQMMDEIKGIHNAVTPTETLFVVDSMTGQDAANTAKAFGEALPLSGVVLTKTDGDARGGAALSVRHITGKPIKYIGSGEKTDALEAFHPDRMASRILGMGDILSLVEQAHEKVDHEKAEKIARKVKKGKGFDLEDLRDQFVQMDKMGGLGSMIDKLPGMGAGMAQAMQNPAHTRQMKRMVAIIDSMTPKERGRPELINGSRKRRMAMGSGTQIQDVNRLLKQHKQMQKMMKKMGSKGGMANMMRGLKGKMPPGMPF